jgi:asparagine synthase (glutamine-hydrolysing)
MLLYFERTSMAHSLEVRVPYLDHRLVEWAATAPASMKVQRGVTKRVLKEAGLQLLPSQTVRKPKVGFSARRSTSGWRRSSPERQASAFGRGTPPTSGFSIDRR